MRLSAILVASLLPALAIAAEPTTQLYAVIAGANRGASGEVPLKYASEDATRVAQVLVEVGGFRRENVTMISEPTAEALRGAIINTNDRIRREAAGRGVLLVYYSGHADAQALHLGADRLAANEVEGLVSGSAASFRVLIVDACRSGALTSVKGATAAPEFAIPTASLPGEGFVVLTAAAAGEDAQEADHLGGSFFTHHFLSGLRGAADDDGDRQVTLDEVYGYVFRETVRSSSATLAGTQHPTFRYDLRGKGDVVLARLDGARTAWLELPTGASYLVFNAMGRVMAEVGREATRRTIALPPGRYTVRGRAASAVLDGAVSVDAGQTTKVEERALERTEYARLVRKGGIDGEGARTQRGARLSYAGHGAWLDGTSGCHGMEVAWLAARSQFTLVPRARACTGRWSNEAVQATQDEAGAELQAFASFDLPGGAAFELGGFLGGLWVRQQLEANGLRSTRQGETFSPTAGLTAGVSVQLPHGIIAGAEFEGRTAVVRDAERELVMPLVLGWRVGVGKYF